MKHIEKTKKEPKQYLTRISRKYVYGGLGVLALIAVLLYLCVPHYRPLKYASAQETTDAHRAIIQKYFLKYTNCKNDTREKTDRIKTFNKYFKTNEFANRAVFRGCNDKDVFLAKDDAGTWQLINVQLYLDAKQTPDLYKACLIEDIAEQRDTSKLIQGVSIYPKKDIRTCDKLAKESYIEVNLKQGIHFHF